LNYGLQLQIVVKPAEHALRDIIDAVLAGWSKHISVILALKIES
jgi:hypothetical protein